MAGDFEAAVVVHGLAELNAALAAARSARRPVLVLSPIDLPAYGGLLWFERLIARGREEFPDVRFEALIDCGNRPAHAIEAARRGFKWVRLDEDAPGFAEVADIAAQSGGRLVAVRPEGLDLGRLADPARALARYFAAEGA